MSPLVRLELAAALVIWAVWTQSEWLTAAVVVAALIALSSLATLPTDGPDPIEQSLGQATNGWTRWFVVRAYQDSAEGVKVAE